ncbi:MAG: protein kinase, partial [Chthoniobacteraceae bacterium]
MTPPTKCLECGADLSPAETQGLCAPCLLKLGLASQLGGSSVPASPGSSGPPPLMPFNFGNYRIVRLLGKGGMGAVYEAEDQASGRRVALKALGHSLDSPDTRKRFLREGRIAASINHPNTVYVFGTEEIDGAPVITMEMVHGGTLHERVKERGPMPVTEAVDAILQIIAGLEAAAVVGILHRDIKPANCFIDPFGTVKVGDFGLSISTTTRGDSALTIAGSVLGTPEFSSPEQLRGEELNVRSDIYSVAVTLYYLLTGKTPFHAENVVQLLATVLDKPAPSPRTVRPDIPEPLARIILRCLAKQAGERFANYDELLRALLPFNSTAPTPATLGLRFLAGAIDRLALSIVGFAIPLMFFADWMTAVSTATQLSPRVLWLTTAMVAFRFIYFAIPEGLWGASLGKAIAGLRVAGFDRCAPGIPRALGRAIVFSLPMVLSFVPPPDGLTIRQMNMWSIGAALAALCLWVLLFCTGRRRNGFAALHDLASRTR